MPNQDKEVYEFGQFRLDVTEHSLVRSSTNERVQIPEKAFETLCVLVRNAGHLVGKDELLRKVWSDSFVEENNLNKSIHAVRRALEEKNGEQQYIETIKKHGFRLVAEVRRVGFEKTADASSQESGRHDAYGNDATLLPAAKHLESDEPETDLQPIPTRSNSARQAKYRLPLVVGLTVLLIGVISFGYLYKAKKAPAGDKTSIAVLPIKPINNGNRDETYELGIADSLILKLIEKGFVVRSLNAMGKYADIAQDPIAVGREQHVDYVLAGNYQLADGKIRLTAQLVNVASGQIEEVYKIESDARDVFAMQDAIAREFGNKLQGRFATVSSGPTASRGTNNEQAYGLFLQGRNLLTNRTPEGTRKAVEKFEQAIQLDQNFARAYSGMAHALIASGNLGAGVPRVEYEKAKDVALKALALDKNLAEGYAVLGELKFTSEWDFVGAEKDLLRALELDPLGDLAHERYAFYLAVRSRFDEAITEAKKSQELNPTSLQHQQVYAVILYLSRRYDEAIFQLKQVIEVDENHPTAYAWLWLVYEMKHDDRQAFEWFMKRQRRIKSEHAELFQKTYEAFGWRGVSQKFFELNKLKEEQKLSTNYYGKARQCALLGNEEGAFSYLDKALEKHQGQMIMLNVEPAFDVLRADSRLYELVRRVGLQ